MNVMKHMMTAATVALIAGAVSATTMTTPSMGATTGERPTDSTSTGDANGYDTRIKIWNHTGKDIKLAKTYEDWAAGNTFTLPDHAASKTTWENQDCNAHEGTDYFRSHRSPAWTNKRDTVAYLGNGYHLTAHNRGSEVASDFWVAKYKGSTKPIAWQRPLDHLRFSAKTCEVVDFYHGTLKFKVHNRGYDGHAYVWDISIYSFNPVT